jgi:hypothetical protein
VVGRLRLTVAMSKGFLKIPFLITDIVLDVDPVINLQQQRKRDQEEEEERRNGPASPASSHSSFDSTTTSTSSPSYFERDEASSPTDTFIGVFDDDVEKEEPRKLFEDKKGEMLPKYDTVFCRLCIRMITVLEQCEGRLGVVPT